MSSQARREASPIGGARDRPIADPRERRGAWPDRHRQVLTPVYQYPENKAARVAGVPMGRRGALGGLANAIVLHRVGRASFITGHLAFNVDGGLTPQLIMSREQRSFDHFLSFRLRVLLPCPSPQNPPRLPHADTVPGEDPEAFAPRGTVAGAPASTSSPRKRRPADVRFLDVPPTAPRGIHHGRPTYMGHPVGSVQSVHMAATSHLPRCRERCEANLAASPMASR